MAIIVLLFSVSACFIVRKQDTSPSAVSAASLHGNEGGVDQEKEKNKSKKKKKDETAKNARKPKSTKAQSNSKAKANELISPSPSATLPAALSNKGKMTKLPNSSSKSKKKTPKIGGFASSANKGTAFAQSGVTLGSQQNAFGHQVQGQPAPEKIKTFDPSMMQNGSTIPAVGTAQLAVAPNVFTAPAGSMMTPSAFQLDTTITTQAMLPTNQDLPEELFTMPKDDVFMTNDPYASKDTLKLCDRLKVGYGGSFFGPRVGWSL